MFEVAGVLLSPNTDVRNHYGRRRCDHPCLCPWTCRDMRRYRLRQYTTSSVVKVSVVVMAKVYAYICFNLPIESQDLPFRQADKHMHMHARIDEALRLPDQRELGCPRLAAVKLSTRTRLPAYAVVVARSQLRTATRRNQNE